MSLCDHCYSPGTCCKSLTLSGGPDSEDRAAMESGRPTYSDALNFARKNGLPFTPLVPEQVQPGWWFWRYSCPKVTPDGRCSIYDVRPQLCRDFEPESDGLCVHSHGTEAGDPSAGVVPFPMVRGVAQGQDFTVYEPKEKTDV